MVPGSVSFFDLNHIIQIAMGWTNSHLFEFRYDRYLIGYVSDEFEQDDNLIDASDVILGETITSVPDKLLYIYDLGDYWQHEVLVEAFLLKEAKTRYPVCTDGARKCPPEDCGSIAGFHNMLIALKDKTHPEHQEYLEWLGGSYDPKHFDLNVINAELPKYPEWMKHWED